MKGYRTLSSECAIEESAKVKGLTHVVDHMS